MPDINIKVAEKIATNVTPGVVIVCGNSDYTVSFDFDAEWEAEPNRVARFVYYKNGKSLYQEAEFTGDTVSVPILSGVDYVLVGVYAGNLRTTTPAKVLCDRSILCGDQIKQTTEVSEEEMQGYAEAAAASAQEAAASAQEAAASAASAASAVNDALEAAKESGDFTGPPGEPGPPGDPGEAGYTPVVGEDYFTDDDKAEFEAFIATELAKRGQLKPEFANSVEECSDITKLYVLPDGYIYAYMEAKERTLTADDFVATAIEDKGVFYNGANNACNRIATKNLLPLSNTISVSCPSPYQYFVYFYTDDTTDSYIGKTTWKSGSIEDVSADVIASGTSEGANYCRISLRDSNNTGANLSDRMNEFVGAISVTQKNTNGKAWGDTGHAFVPADYEDRIIALEERPASAENKYTGKKITFIGDSLTWGYCENGARSVNPYPQVVQDNLGCVSVNIAVSGTSFSSMLSGQVPNIPDDTDYVCVMAGTNNRTQTELGEITDTAGNTWSALLYQLLVGIKNKVPNAKIILFTPISNSNAGVLTGDFIRNVQQTILTAQYYGIPCIDVYGNCGFSYHIESDRARYYSDALHLNDAGYLMLGNIISDLLLACGV